MIAHIRRQLLQAIPILLGVSALVFLMLSYIPGSAPDILALQAGTALSGEELEAMRDRLGLNDPMHVQYWRFLSNAVKGDLGRSFRSNRQVTEVILEAIPNTAQLAVSGMVIAVTLGITLGIIAGVRRGTWVDTIVMILSLIGWSMPSFWLGIILLLIFAVNLNLFPVTGSGGLDALVLPAMTLGLSAAGLIARLTRTEILEEMGKEYVVTARAKGLSQNAVVIVHVLKNSLISVVTMVGLQFGRLLGGTVIIETVFSRQGVGRIAVDALLARDMPIVLGAALFLAVIFVTTNLVVDITYGILDPRIRASGA
jgi:peptide/nickel transport system permease protein